MAKSKNNEKLQNVAMREYDGEKKVKVEDEERERERTLEGGDTKLLRCFS